MKKFMAVFVLLLASALIFSTAPFPVRAEVVGDFTVTGGENGTDYTYEDGVLTILRNTELTISGNTTTDRIVVDSEDGANIILSGVNINWSGYYPPNNYAAFEIAESTKETVTITLDGENVLKSALYNAGLQKISDVCKLIIQGQGEDSKLEAVGGISSAGIGGGNLQSGKNITIKSGTIIAAGNGGGAGIGGGGISDYSLSSNTDAENIEIFGTAKVTATGNGGAGIGGGVGGNADNIKIYGDAIVNAKGDLGTGAGIGGGDSGNGTNITISGNAYVEARATTTGAGIGGGGGGSVNAGNINNGSNITIEGNAVVKAYAFNGGAGIGGGQYGNGSYIKIKDNADVTADGDKVGAGIGGGTGGQNNGGTQGNGSNITISGNAKVTATGNSGAGIGGGQYGNASDIEISGKVVIKATSSNSGAGIGGGYEGSANKINIKDCKTIEAKSNGTGAGIGGGGWGGTGGTGTNITISGGEVTATGGSVGCAGIGGGTNGDGTNITINGGKVTANGKGGGAGIGGSSAGVGSKIYIYDAYVEATGEGYGAGIGGGSNHNGSEIHIYTDKGETTVIAKSTGDGAGIGGGISGHGIDIKISGNATVEAEGNRGAGIGSGAYASGSPTDVTISGNADVTASSTNGAGIGGGQNGGQETTNVITINGGNVKATSEKSVGIGDTTGAPTITISGGTVTAIGAVGLGSDLDIIANNPTDETISRAVVKIKGTSSENYPWVFTNSIKSANYANRENNDADGYWGIVFEYASGNSFTDKETNNFNEGIVYGKNKTVSLAKPYTLTSGKKLTVLDTVTFKTNEKLTLDASTLYLNEGAKLDKWYKTKKENDGKIQHEDRSDYQWYYSDEKKLYDGATLVDPDLWDDVSQLYTNDKTGREGIVLCDICGEPEPHAATTDDWETNSTHHWKVGECELGEDCSIKHNDIESCSYTRTIGGKTVLDYGVHRFGEPTKEADGLWHYICMDCLYEKTAAELITPKPTPTPSTRTGIIMLYKVDSANGSPLEGAKFGIYSDEECTSLIMSDTSAMSGGNAVVSFKVDAGDTYYVKEISAPSGYRLSGKVFRAKVSSDGTVTYSVVGSAGTSEDIPVCENVKGIGNPGTAAGLGVAGIAVMSGMVVAVSLIKRAESGKNRDDES